MKKLLTMIVVILSLQSVYSQSSERDEHGQSSMITFVTSPGSWDDGYSLGFGYEHHNTYVYYGAELYWFPGLNEYDYGHAIGRFGFNQEWGKKTTFRVHGGARLGAIYRETAGSAYSNMGVEMGVQLTLPFGLFGRVAYSVDECTDSKLWSNDDSFTRRSVYVSIGVRL